MTQRSLARLLIATLLGTCASMSALADRPEPSVVPGAYGYLVVDQSDPRCPFDFIDIGTGGDAVWFTASAAAPADDDGGAVVPLEAPFELFGAAVPGLVMSTNGYVAAATSLASDAGGDFSGDTVLPAIPDNPPATPVRLLVYHADLDGQAASGTAHSRFFATCPRPSGCVDDEPCTVLQWSDWSLASGDASFSFQAILYHVSFQIAYQLRPGASALTGGTIGVQGRSARDAAQFFYGASGLAADTAVCFLDPRFPTGGRVADLSILVNDKVDGIGPGAEVTYAVSVTNDGPSPVHGAVVRDPVPDTLLNCSWTCEASEESSCSVAGNGEIDDLADVAGGGWVDYRLTCQAALSRGEIANSASVTAPAGVFDPVLSNNTSTDVDRIFNDPWVCRAPQQRVGPVVPEQTTGEATPSCRPRLGGRATDRGTARTRD